VPGATTRPPPADERYTQYVNPPEYILPHSDFGDPECCGLLLPFERGDFADIICNECGAIVRTVPTADLRRTLDDMQLKLDVASERCPHCRSVNLLPGFSQMLSFTCRSCGRAVVVKAL
jgi:ribosomal protein S27E